MTYEVTMASESHVTFMADRPTTLLIKYVHVVLAATLVGRLGERCCLFTEK